jgi:hypothetical protein
MRRTNIVVLGHGQWDFGSYGQAYHEAAKLVLARLRRRTKAFDGMKAAPVIFLYRHAVELYLKSIVHVGRTVFLTSGRPEPQLTGDLYQTHRLDHLLDPVTKILKPIGVRAQTPIAGLGSYADLKRLICELNKYDELSYAFRYPVNTKGRASVPKGTTLDIEQFGVVFDTVLTFLAGCNAFLESRWSAMVAAHAKAEDEGKEGLWPEVPLAGFVPCNRMKNAISSLPER